MYHRKNVFVVVVQWSERRQLRSEALGSIPSGYPGIFSCFYPDLPPVAVLTTNRYSYKCLPILDVWRLGGLVTRPSPSSLVNLACSSSSNTEGECWVAAW